VDVVREGDECQVSLTVHWDHAVKVGDCSPVGLGGV